MGKAVQFKLTKDEALILAEALQFDKYRMCNDVGKNKAAASEIVTALNELQHRLEVFATDKRLHRGITFNERVKHYVNLRIGSV